MNSRMQNLLLAVAAIIIIGACGQKAHHDVSFVGQWRSGLPVSGGIVPENIARAERMNAQIQESIREMNASGEQGVALDLREDGTFSMHVWMSLSAVMSEPQGERTRIEHSVTGEWQSEGNEIYLTAKDGFLPYAFTRNSRGWSASRSGGSRSSLIRSEQFLPLARRSNGRLSQFPDKNVRPGVHERGLDFVRVSE